MATKREIDFAYTLIDRIFRLAMGENADISGALYDGDYSLTLEQAQQKKHEFIFKHLNVKPGDRILDIGCGWGPVLNYFRGQGVKGVGVTLSTGQAEACQRNGLEAHIRDYKTITPDTFGTFDGVTSLGAFEHFCSYEQYREGKQDAVYEDLFKRVHDLLPDKGRFFLQTMVFGRTPFDPNTFDFYADKSSNEYVMATMTAMFPGSWLPYGLEHIVRCASPYFNVVTSHSGRLDYIETIRQWDKRYNQPSLRNYLLRASLLPRYLLSQSFRRGFASGVNANLIVFERELFDHFRIVFEKK